MDSFKQELQSLSVDKVVGSEVTPWDKQRQYTDALAQPYGFAHCHAYHCHAYHCHAHCHAFHCHAHCHVYHCHAHCHVSHCHAHCHAYHCHSS